MRLTLAACILTVIASLGDQVIVSAGQRAPVNEPRSSRELPTSRSAPGYLNLHKRHPDGLEGPADFDSLTPTVGLERLSQMQDFLESFAKLTERVRKDRRQDLTGVKNTEQDMQTIGFHNIPLLVEGVIRRNDYLLKRAEYEIAQLKISRGQATQGDVDRARARFEQSTRAFQIFWDTKRPSD